MEIYTLCSFFQNFNKHLDLVCTRPYTWFQRFKEKVWVLSSWSSLPTVWLLFLTTMPIFLLIFMYLKCYVKYSFFVFSNLFGKQSVVVICQILKWFLRRKQQEKQDTGFVSRENMTNMQWLCCKQTINRDMWRCRSQWTFRLGRLEGSTLFHMSMDYLFFNLIIYCRPLLFHICLENILKS